MDRPPATRTIRCLQALRAVAAGAVALKHILHEAISTGRDPSGWLTALHTAMPWDAGVDIFFVISGFVIVHSSAPLFARRGGAATFLRRRLTRVVPLYWLMTTLLLAILAWQPASVRGAVGDGLSIALSYLFIPWPRPDGLVQPALGLGWTLNYEMFFYVVMSGFIALPRPIAVAGCAMLLTCLVLAGTWFGFTAQPIAFWAGPIVLEFVFGMALALLSVRLGRVPVALRIALVAVAVIVLRLHLHVESWERVAVWGLPGALLVLAAITEPQDRAASRLIAGMVRLGDASYAMYLVHPFPMRACSIIAERLGWNGAAGGVALVLCGLVAAQLAALLLNRYFEQPIRHVLRGSGRRGSSLQDTTTPRRAGAD